MRTIQWLLGASLATVGLIAACSDSSSDNPPVADAGTDTSVADTYVPPVDTGAPDTGIVDSGPAVCTTDADLSTISPADAALGDSGSVGTCLACSRAGCGTQLAACQADCDCTVTLSCFFDCIGQAGGSLLGCGQQCGADITTAGPTQDAILCTACGCKAECNVPAVVNSFCPKPPSDASSDAPATDGATDSSSDAPADAPTDG